MPVFVSRRVLGTGYNPYPGPEILDMFLVPESTPIIEILASDGLRLL